MSLLLVAILSVLSGWVVNLLADGIPDRRNILDVICSFRPLGQAHRARYIIVIIAAIVLGELAYQRAGWSMMGAVLAIQAWFFLAIAVIDFEHRRVFNRMLAPALPLILISNWMTGVPSIRSALWGALFGFCVFLILALAWRGAMGMGDVKLAGVIGLATGLSGSLIALLVSFYAGGVAAVVILLRSRKRGQTMAYAPYLVLGAWVAIFFGKDIWRFYLSLN